MGYKGKTDKRNYNREYVKERRYWLKKYHLCTECKKQDAYTLAGSNMCAECLAKQRKYNQKYYDKPEIKERRSDKQKEIKAFRRQNGLCTECGQKLPEGYSYITCEACRAKSRQKHVKERERKNAGGSKIPKSMWRDMGLCVQCGKPRMNTKLAWQDKDTQLCESCYAKAAANLVKAREKYIAVIGATWGDKQYRYGTAHLREA